ncbi:inner membrane translocase subunit tim21 [Trichodelitschia bisporula]|uniref:Mitochondrial import inner membrane translocase subunit Tim21 n=1 Tax=Trichodelitschia bisporula TaxID=703511 RepID=A0A6G1HII2_9PEZI|nr:inner membrane translocase subunit tim21 [Trichodelitschia bisporula]
MGALHINMIRTRLFALYRPHTIRLCAAPTSAPLARTYATHQTLGGKTPSRKQITVIGDDGRVNWADLSTREKAARTTQQSVNLLVILAGVILTGAVATALYTEVFAVDSKVAHFNRAVDRIKRNSRCIEVLGSRRDIKAYGESSWNRWNRNRAIASRRETDRMGTEHFYMHFNVEGPLSRGVAQVHLTKRKGDDEWEYRLLALDVEGHQRIYLENSDAKFDKRSGKMFGVRWW